MAHILQRPTESGQRLHLLAEGKDGAAAELVVGNLTTQPLEDDLDGDETRIHGEQGSFSAIFPERRGRDIDYCSNCQKSFSPHIFLPHNKVVDRDLVNVVVKHRP